MEFARETCEETYMCVELCARMDRSMIDSEREK
jgi:hypothetical protein